MDKQSGILGIYARTSIDTEGTSIDQQKNLGISFAAKNGLEYQLYEDNGKSGFKIDDDENPFKHRKGLTKLISDIENKIVNKVWVFEHSRLSRNQHSSYVLFRIFEKHNITVFENGKPFDMNNPQNKMIQGILTQIAEYERQLIIGRTTRGLHDSYNRRGRSFNFVYGYKKGGINESGYMKWIPVESELENVKYAFKNLLDGKSIKIITSEIFNNVTDLQMEAHYRRLIRIFRQYAYTGYSLNTDGLEILNQYKDCKLESLFVLHDKKYWLKSVPLPIEVVSIEDWIKAVEKLQIAKVIYKDKIRKTDSEILTGIIECPICEMKYYLYNGGKYKYYKHFSNNNCGQKPKSFKVEELNNLFEVFFFYFYMVFDDTKNLIEESQRLIKINLLEIKEKIKNIENENRKLDKQIERFQSIYEDSNDTELLKLTLIKEKELTLKKDINITSLRELKYKLEGLNHTYNKDELELTYHNVKETVINYLSMSNEKKRAAIIKIIKKCQIFGKQMLISTGKILFVFDMENKYKITDSIWEQLKSDTNFKDNFLNTSKLSEALKDDTSFQTLIKSHDKKMLSNYLSVRRLGDIHIFEFPKIIMKNRLKKLGIDYEFTGIEKIISFSNISFDKPSQNSTPK